MAHVYAHPAQFYVRYLLLVQEDPGLAAVNKILSGLGVAQLTPEQHAVAADSMRDVPDDFRPWDPLHLASVRWLKAKRIHSLVHRDETSAAMNTILRDARLREVVERMLIGGVRHTEVVYRTRNLGFQVTEEAVADFRHYFWNTEVMGTADWSAYFREDKHGRTRDLSDGYDAALLSGAPLALYRSGVRVEVDRKEALEDIYRELIFTFHEVRSLPTTQKKVEMLASLSRSITRVHERMDASDSALQDVLKKFEKFKVLTDDEQLLTANQLAPTGTFSDTTARKLLKEKK